jgi:hypothetical protein
LVAAGFGAALSIAIAALWWSRMHERRLAAGAVKMRT